MKSLAIAIFAAATSALAVKSASAQASGAAPASGDVSTDVPRGEGHDLNAVTFGDYAPLAGGWIPRDVAIDEGGKVIQRERYRDIKANIDAPPSMFDPAMNP